MKRQKNEKVLIIIILTLVSIIVGIFSLRAILLRTGLPVWGEMPLSYSDSAVFAPLKHAWSEQSALGYPSYTIYQPPGAPQFYHYGPLIFSGYYFLYFISGLVSQTLAPLVMWCLGILLQLIGVYLILKNS